MTKYLKHCVAGLLLQKELDYLYGAVSDPPFVAAVGGAKVSTKFGIIRSLLEKVNKIVSGGRMVLAFLLARGLTKGSSLVEEDQVRMAKQLDKLSAAKGVELKLPTEGGFVMDIGPNSINKIYEQ